MKYQEVITHGSDKDKEAVEAANKDCGAGRYVASVTPILWDDATEQYIVTEEPMRDGDMRHTYFLEV